MKRTSHYIRLLLTLLPLWGMLSCETIIDASIASGPTQLAVDAWLTDQPGEQRIKLTQTANYFNNGPSTPATSASVAVGDNAGRRVCVYRPG